MLFHVTEKEATQLMTTFNCDYSNNCVYIKMDSIIKANSTVAHIGLATIHVKQVMLVMGDFLFV